MENGNRKGLTASSLKLIAMLAMLVDHLAIALLGGRVYTVGRMIGRVAFPIFAFLVAEGEAHTHSRQRYALRLLGGALLSELPFRLLFYRRAVALQGHNVLFTLLLGLLVLWALRRVREEPCLKNRLLFGGGLLAALAVAALLQTDYGAAGVLTVLLFGLLRRRWPWCALAMLPLFTLLGGPEACLFELPACFALLPLAAYNGQAGNKLPRHTDYFFYPGHLLLLYVAQWLVKGL